MSHPYLTELKMLYAIDLATAGSVVDDIIPALIVFAVMVLAATFID